MISGLELAFAIVPIVISATEHHQKGIRKLRTFASPDEKLQDFVTDLHDEVSLLALTLKYLISDLTMLTEKQREQLLDLDRERWKQDDVSIALKTRLGDAELAFTDILERLLKCLDEIVSEKSLRFISSEVTNSFSLFKKLQGFREAMKNGSTVHSLGARFQFTTKEERRNKNIKKISKCNKMLERIVHGQPAGINGEAKKTSRQKARTPTNRSRRMSQSIHERIAHNWSCPCPSPHEARLGLLNCLMNSDNADSAMNLDLLVSMTSEDEAKEIWLGSRIRILLDKEEPKGKSLVRFAEDNSIELDPSPRAPRHYINSESVCALIKEAHKNNSSLELVFDGENLWQARSNASHIILQPEIGIPLKTLLGDSESRLTLKEKRVLAVVLAHAILHYCESPWVSNNWNKDHVNFFATVKGPDLMRPYLATQFEPLSVIEEETSINVYSHPNPALLSLGILLLELYLSKPIESLWELDDTENGMEGANTNWITAEKQLDKLRDDLYEGYKNAIEACLKIDYGGNEDSLSLNDEGFRKLVYERVVLPLEDELKNGFGVTAEDLGVL